MSDDGSILIGRAGSFFTGFTGVLWIEDIGWMTFDEFFRKQGVVEAQTRRSPTRSRSAATARS